MKSAVKCRAFSFYPTEKTFRIYEHARVMLYSFVYLLSISPYLGHDFIVRLVLLFGPVHHQISRERTNLKIIYQFSELKFHHSLSPSKDRFYLAVQVRQGTKVFFENLDNNECCWRHVTAKEIKFIPYR